MLTMAAIIAAIPMDAGYTVSVRYQAAAGRRDTDITEHIIMDIQAIILLTVSVQ